MIKEKMTALISTDTLNYVLNQSIANTEDKAHHLIQLR